MILPPLLRRDGFVFVRNSKRDETLHPILKLLETLRMVRGTRERSSIFHLTERRRTSSSSSSFGFSPRRRGLPGCANIISRELPANCSPAEFSRVPSLTSPGFSRARSPPKDNGAPRIVGTLEEYETLLFTRTTNGNYLIRQFFIWKSAYLRAGSRGMFYRLMYKIPTNELRSVQEVSKLCFSVKSLKNSILRFSPKKMPRRIKLMHFTSCKEFII